jgi:hypothetical protein
MQATRTNVANRSTSVGGIATGRVVQHDILSPMSLAECAATPEERRHHLRDAVQAGIHRWAPERRKRPVAWWDELETRPFLMAVYALGHQSATMGLRNEAVSCVRLLVKLDPNDRMGVEEMAKTVGLMPKATAETAAGLRM